MNTSTRRAGLSVAAAHVLGLVLLVAGCSERIPEKVVAEPDHSDHTATAPQSTQGAKVLLVHSYHPEYPWVDAISRGVIDTLEGTGVSVEIFYMDTKRKTDEAWKARAGELAQRKLQEHQPDIVITVDDNAQQYFAKRYVDGEIPFVFCGVNADPSKYGYPASNVTGVIERAHFKGTLQYVQHVRPIKKIAMLSSDDPTSVGALNFMKQDFVDAEVVEWNLVSDFDEWKEAVSRYNDTVDAFGVYMYHTIKEKGNPTSLDPKTVMEWTAQHATVPTLGFFEFGIEDGLLMGVVESGFEHGEKAAKYALEILKGTPITSLPVTKANVGMKMMNSDTAGRFGIEIMDDLLDGARIVPEE